MMFLLTKDWACGSAGGTRPDLTIPAGTQIDGTNPQWRGMPLALPVPVSAQALDAAAATALTGWYPNLTQWFVHQGF
jgi:hypothetical protein